MSEIPEDVMEAAEKADAACLRDHCQRTACNGFLCVNALDAVYVRAIAAERDRCAQLAQTHIPEGIHPDDLYRWRDTAGAIAAAIRTGN